MITYKKKTNKIIYDINKIEQAHKYALAISAGNGVTREQKHLK